MKIGGLVSLCLFWKLGIAMDLSLLSSFAKQNAASSIVFFSCWSEKDNWQFNRLTSSEGMYVTIHTSTKQEFSTMDSLKTKYHHIAVLLDVQCENYIGVLQNAFKMKYLKTLHHWLLISSDPESDVFVKLESVNLLLDSHVTVAFLGSLSNPTVLQEVYSVGWHQQQVVSAPHYWIHGEKLPSRVKRNNYGGIPIKTAILVIKDTWENFLDMRYKNVNTPSKCNYMLMLYISITLNFTMNLTITDTWGYPRKDSPCYDGVVGLLECTEVELSAIALIQKDARWDRIDYAGETVDFRGRFMFLKPSLSEVSIIYTLPFKTTVWVAYFVTAAIITVMLYYTQRLEYSKDPSQPPVTFSDAALNSLAMICQEGTPRSPICYSSRIVFMFMLLLSLFLTTSYSAIIVSLLQTSSGAVNNLRELIESPFTLSMRDIAYNTKLVNDTKDPLIKKLFQDKLYTQPYQKAFTSHEKGVENMRRGLYAFYGDAEAYKVMSDTYEEDEKCRLKEITINPSNVLNLPVKKGSQYKEHIGQKVRWLREAGLISREYKRWFVQKPKCDADRRGFVSVRIKDFYPILVILSSGMGISIIFFIFELLSHKTIHGTYWPQKDIHPINKFIRSKNEIPFIK